MSTGVELPRRLDSEGIRTDQVLWNLSVAALDEEAARRREGVITAEGPLVCRTGRHTGRSPNYRFIVRDASSAARVAWGAVAYAKDGGLNLDIPATCPGVPSEVLHPPCTWASGTEYDRQAAKLARMFAENFNTFEAAVSDTVKAAGPHASL